MLQALYARCLGPPDMADKLSHINAKGDAQMVDIAGKSDTARMARASGFISFGAAALAQIADGTNAKGDVLGTARIAGIMAAKQTSSLIPLCHPLPLSSVTVDFEMRGDGISISAMATTTGKTGVEMEALTAVSVAALTLYDMLKAVDKGMVIGPVQLEEKTGGKSGNWVR